jgi:hypothetical protein
MALKQVGVYLSRSELNENIAKMEATGDYVVGRGVLSGLDLTDGGSLSLQVHSGVYHLMGSSVIVDSTLTLTMPASGTNSVWIDENKTLSYTSSDVDSGDLVCLGRVTTSGGVITITENGRVYLMRTSPSTPGTYNLGTGIVMDGVNSRVGIGTDSPTNALEVVGNLQTSTADVDGAATVGATLTVSGHIPIPTAIETLTTHKHLTKTMANMQVLTASGANRKVMMPTTLDWGTNFTIVNGGSSNNILVRDSGDTATIATLTPGQSVKISAAYDSGVPGWPVTVTPVDPGVGVGV